MKTQYFDDLAFEIDAEFPEVPKKLLQRSLKEFQKKHPILFNTDTSDLTPQENE